MCILELLIQESTDAWSGTDRSDLVQDFHFFFVVLVQSEIIKIFLVTVREFQFSLVLIRSEILKFS